MLGYDLQVLFHIINLNAADRFYVGQESWEIHNWRWFETNNVHMLELENRFTVYMLYESIYPLIRELTKRMLDHGLEVYEESILPGKLPFTQKRVYEESEAVKELIALFRRRIKRDSDDEGDVPN